jgi:hypothetical protein
MGMNTMMLYTFPLQMFHGEQWAAQQKQALDAADAIGMKILMDIEGFVRKRRFCLLFTYCKLHNN